MPQPSRQLAAILFTDMVGYTLMMQQDEKNAVLLNRRYTSVLKEIVPAHGGEILNDYGDGSLCSFSSATAAVKCAIEFQQQLQQDPAVPLRAGLHVGEIFFEDGKIYGDGVNISSRIQSLGCANSILFSSEIRSKLKNQQEFKTISIGKFNFKHVEEPLEIFALANDGLAIPDRKKMQGKLEEKKTSRNRIIIAAVIALVILASFLVYRQFSRHAGFTGTAKSIGVLPFETISSEKENEYVSDGFTIDIINKLSQISGLQSVPGWSRVKIFKNSKMALKDIAGELDVAAILTGTIQKQADRLHINAELIDVNTGKTIWNTNDERSWGDVLKLQSEVAEKIVSSLSAHLSPEEEQGIKKQYTNNSDAYTHYIKGRYFWDIRTTASFDSAESNYKKAIELDPNFALAYAGLADIFIFNQKGLTQLESIPIARDYANKAVSLDSTLGEPLATLGFIQSVFDYDWKKSKQTLQKALKLNPGFPYTHIFYGNLLINTGENTEKGLDEIRKARELDPTSVSTNWILGRTLYLARKYDEAETQLRKTIEMGPKYILARNTLCFTLLAKKKYDEAIEVARQVPAEGITTSILYQGPLLSIAYARAGKTEQARMELDKLLHSNNQLAHWVFAAIYVALNDHDKAIEELKKCERDKEIFLYFIKVDPSFDPLREDPRFKEMLARMNLN